MADLPHTKLMGLLLKQPMGSEESWPDYWRGFWDATRSLRRNPGRVLSYKTDRYEYDNGYKIGDGAYKACKERRK